MSELSKSDSEESEPESDYSDCVPYPTLFSPSFLEYIQDDPDSVFDPFMDPMDWSESESIPDYDDLSSSGLGFEFDRLGLSSESRESPIIRGLESNTSRLSVVGMESESESDSDDMVVNFDGIDPNGDSGFPILRDCVGFNDNDHRIVNEELEWEDVDDTENLSWVTDPMEEVSSVSLSPQSWGDVGEDDEEWFFDWELLLEMNNFDRNLEFENHWEDGSDVNDGHMTTPEYNNTLFGQFVEGESALRGSPPAAKWVVEYLPIVVLTKEDLEENSVVCAVCKDEVLVEESVIRLPCFHYYHECCILPWLSIRNTCPVCRYELPTDDVDYEQRKNEGTQVQF